MLKHVQISPMRNRSDTASLRSSSNASFCSNSICGSPEPPTELQRTPSRASSYSSLNEQPPQTTIKVYTNCLKIDIEYKTLGIQWDTTSKEIITQLLRRLKMRHRDPRLFYLSMEVAVRRAGVKTILTLDEDTRPAIMQACHPKGESRFCLQLKPGGLIRVHTSALHPSSQYKSLVISKETNCDELLQLLLGCYSSLEPVENFSLYEVCPGQECQRKLHADDLPLRVQAERLHRGESCHFLVRRTPNYSRRRQLLANLNQAIKQSQVAANEVEEDCAETDSLLELSMESELSLSEHLRSCSSDEDAEDDECVSSSGSSDNSTECALYRNFHHRSIPSTLKAEAKGNNNTQRRSMSPQARTYSPVYNIREIRTATHSFSSLGKDKKLLDIHMNGRYAPTGVYSCLLPVSEVETGGPLDMNANSTVAMISTASATSKLTAEAVNNNPAKGLGHFVYL
ncbi:hypothetical protein KR093_003280 [Drosophila rubida]|uniref:Ras-associating domain-containing protein n=1 Tax=Drosophila rubida TaxID=30044 RepID=A0AAD4PMU2_9MUSC|nr:hypothetical protein KR093_003280 [Drosophila rubida]